MRILPVSLGLIALLPAFADAQGRRMTTDDVMAIKTVTDAQISPDGQWVAYTVTRADLEQNAADANIWIVSAKGGEPTRLTSHKKRDTSPRWSPDGKRIAFISEREDKPQLYLISPFGGEPERYTEQKGGVRALEWSRDGASIALVVDQEPTADDEKRTRDKNDAIVVDSGYRFSRLAIIDLATRKARVISLADGMIADPQWSPDGREIAYTTVPTPKADDGVLSDIWIIPSAGGQARKLLENPGPDNSPRWSPDGTQVAFISSPRYDVRQSTLKVISATGGAERTVPVNFLYQPSAPSWSPDGRTLYFGAGVRTTSQIFSVPAAGGAPKQVTDAKGILAGGTFSRDGKTIAFTQGDVQHPNDVHIATLGGAAFAPVKLTVHNPELRNLALGASEVVKWKGSDGMEIEGILIYPVGYQRGTRIPVVAQIHGGPAGAWTQTFAGVYGNNGHVLAGQGFGVFYPNPRGSSQYGEPFLRANIKDWGGGDYLDIQTGLDALVARGIADSTKLAQSGWSYGGYMTAWTLTQTNRFKAVVVGAGLTDMFSMYSTNDIPRTIDGYFGAEPWNDTTEYRKRSAMTYIKNAKTPTLILHGQSDLRVPIGQAQELYVGLKKNNVPVQLVFYPREGHGLQEPRHQIDRMTRENAFIRRYVLGESAALLP